MIVKKKVGSNTVNITMSDREYGEYLRTDIDSKFSFEDIREAFQWGRISNHPDKKVKFTFEQWVKNGTSELQKKLNKHKKRKR